MDAIWDKIGAIIAAIITALGGFYMYDRKTTNDRLTKLEIDAAKDRIDIRIIETRFEELKSDTQEIKETQKLMLGLLTNARRKV